MELDCERCDNGEECARHFPDPEIAYDIERERNWELT